MQPYDSRPRRLVTWIAATVAITVALTLPLGYFSLGYQSLESAIETKAEIKAAIVGQIITSRPDTWMFLYHRMEQLLTRQPVQLENEFARVLDKDGNVIAAGGADLALPVLTRSAKLFDSGTEVGTIEVSHSLRGLLLRTGGVAVFGLLLALAVYVTLRLIPLRALDQALSALAREKERAEVTLHSIGDAVVSTDTLQHIDYLNPVAEKLTGWKNAEAHGRRLSEILRLIDETTAEPVENPLRRAIADNRLVTTSGKIAVVPRNGAPVSVEQSAAPIRNEQGTAIGGVIVLRDVSTARSLAENLSWQAAHDALTGLVNRREFETRLDGAIASARDSGKHHIVCYLDLDQFKVVNDTCGHRAGDELLKQVGSVLSGRIRGADTLARIGGDEFALLLEGCPMDRAQLIVADLLAAIRDMRFQWESKVFTIGASVGLAAVKGDGRNSSDILSAADAACYAAKEQGRNQAAEHRTLDSHIASRRREMDWVTRVTRALDENRLTLHYQSYLALSQPAGSEKHIELLVRMIDEQGELVLPGSFLPAAERYNLIPAIDRWVVERVFSCYRELATQLGGNPLICAVNISGATINSEGFFDFVRERARLHKLPRGVVCFEITETAVINNLRRAAGFMEDMKALGFQFALDDFGVGTSSFGYLQNLPVDYIKIDGSFVRDIIRNPVNRAMAETINRIGHIMGKRTVAEFVETDALISELQSMGVDFAQGYAIAKPQPLLVSYAVESERVS